MKVYSKDAPYEGTKIPVEKSKDDIDRTLRKYSITKIAWNFDPEHDDIELHFQFEETIDNVKLNPIIRLKPPEIWKTVKGYSRKEQRLVKGDVIYWPQAMRCLYWYIKTHLEMTQLGIPKTQEFLPNITTMLDDKEVSLKEVIIPKLNRFDAIAVKTQEIPLIEEKVKATA